MKKKFIAAMIAVVVAVFAGYNIYQSQNTVALSDLALANVEALADGESSSDCHATICNKSCKVGSITYTYKSTSQCSCSLCTGD